MSRFDDLINNIENNRNNPPLWIPLRYPSLSKHMGITKRMYHLIGGDAGTGKTAFVDQTYLLDAHTYSMKNQDKGVPRIKTTYFSMERSQEYKKAKLLANKMFLDHNIIVSVPALMNWGMDEPIPDTIIGVAKSYKDFFDTFYEDVEIYDGIDNPTGVWNRIRRFALANGTLYGKGISGKAVPWKITLNSYLSSHEEDKRKIIIPESELPRPMRNYEMEFVQDDPHMILQIVLDHMGKPRSERGFTEKETIDKMSEYLAIARDLYGMNVVVINQFNRNIAGIQRRVNTDLSPEQQDFKGSGNTYEDADVVVGLFNPYKYNLKKYAGYEISKTVNDNGFSRFRAISLLKNSYGVDNLIAGFKFVGECGYFGQLPTPNDINYQALFNE